MSGCANIFLNVVMLLFRRQKHGYLIVPRFLTDFVFCYITNRVMQTPYLTADQTDVTASGFGVYESA